jgi:glycosyltransferase involved in cell wall biosynthesis
MSLDINTKKSNTNGVVSVIIPCTDRTAGLKRCLESVLRQDYAGSIEIILVENNSTDSIVIRKLVSVINNQSIKHFYLENCENANVARNYGTRKSSGIYVAYLDSDDFWLPNHISNNMNFFDANPEAVALYSGYVLNDGIKDTIVSSRPIIDETAYSFLFGHRPGVAQTSSYLLKRYALDVVEWDETLNRNQDYDFFASIQKIYGWQYNPLITSIVVWEHGVVRKFTASAFKDFYSKHKEHMLTTERAGYVSRVLRALSQNSKEEYLEFYSEGLLLRQKMQFPECMYSYGYGLAKFILWLRLLIAKIN